VNHNDGKKYNNFASNLEWCNRSENVLHSFYNKLNDCRHYNIEFIEKICELMENGTNDAKDICKILNIEYDGKIRALITDLRRCVRYRFITKKYDFSNYKKKKYERLRLVHDICQVLQDNRGITSKNICELLSIEYISKNKDLIKKIKSKKHYKDIVKLYNI
jgi:hypothetical protein